MKPIVEPYLFFGGQCEAALNYYRLAVVCQQIYVRWHRGQTRDPRFQAFGARFGIHPLTLEDLHNTLQRPKVEVFEGYTFVVLKMMSWDPSLRLVAEQVGMVVQPGLVVSFLEEQVAGDVFDGVRASLRGDRGRASAGPGCGAFGLGAGRRIAGRLGRIAGTPQPAARLE